MKGGNWRLVMKMTAQVVGWIAIVVVMGFLLACGEGGCELEISAEILTSQGWAKFEVAEFDEALKRFDQALNEAPAYGEAYNGKGWAFMRLDSLGAALNAFGFAISKGVSRADPRAGLAVVYRDLDPVDFQSAVDWADSALSIDSRYAFCHDTGFSWLDLRLILAQAYFALGAYDQANVQVDSLGGNVLDPDSETFVEDLLTEIQRIGEGI